MKAEARVGAISAAAGTVNPLTSTPAGALIVSGGNGSYREATLAGRVFAAANQAVVTTVAYYNTTYTGLVLANPSTSGKNAILIGFSFAYSVAASAATWIGLMTGKDAGDAAAAIVPRNRLMGGPDSVMVVDNGCTLVGTPVLEQLFAQISSVATTAYNGAAGSYDLQGSLIVTPGYYVAVCSFAINTAPGNFAFLWEEVAV